MSYMTAFAITGRYASARHICREVLVVCLILGAHGALAQTNGLGLGVIIGEPTGLSAKMWTSEVNALDVGLGWSVGTNWIGTLHGHDDHGHRLHVHMDYLWHAFTAIHENRRFPLYYGLGARINTGAGYDGSFAVRGVIGIMWLPVDTMADVFVEIAPSFELLPAAGFSADAGLGVRYYP